MSLNETKCPFCAEIIKKDALICKLCGSQILAEPRLPNQSQTTRKNRTFRLIILILLAVLAFTNPNQDDFNYVFIKHFQDSNEIKRNDIIGKIATGVASYAINAITRRDNYLIFSIFEIDNSLIKIIDPSSRKTQYLGILGQIIPIEDDWLAQEFNW